MAKTRDQKKKLLYVLKILEEKTDKDHPMNTAQLIEALEKYDIYSERKSIYNDIDTLKDSGYKIAMRKARPAGYYMESREFDQIELKLLVDAVQSSNFITKSKTQEIITKLKTLTNEYIATQLEQRNVNISEPLKQSNHKSFTIANNIHTAIGSNSAISFQYCDWNSKKEFLPRYDGRIYQVSPYLLTFDNGKYYMIAFDHSSNSVRNYRVDKINNITILDIRREGKDEFKNFDLPKHSVQTFGMYNGNLDTVMLQFKEKLAGVMIDRFGTKPTMRPLMSGDKYFGEFDAQINIEVAVSTQFYGWIAGLGSDVVIVGPKYVCEEYKEHLTGIRELY